jgi:hypothetical protein
LLKKLIFKLLGAAFIMFGLSTYVGYLYTGQLPPLLSGLHGVLPARGAAPAAAATNWTDIGSMQGTTETDEGGYQRVESGATTFYKWQDAQGRWHFDQRKPPETVKAAQQTVSVPAIGSVAPLSPKEALPSPQEDATKPASGPAPESTMANPYSRDGVQQILDQARDVQRMMNEHNQRTGQM